MESDVTKILLPLDAKLELLGYEKQYGSDNPSKVIDLLIDEIFALRGARDEAQTRSQRSAKELESAMNKVRLPLRLSVRGGVQVSYPNILNIYIYIYIYI